MIALWIVLGIAGAGAAALVVARARTARRRAQRASRPPSTEAWIAERYDGVSGTRAYKLYVPRHARGRRLPLVVMLHGCMQDADDFAAGTAMNELAEAAPFLVVYPEQTRAANARGCWNWFRPAHQERDGGEPAILAGITRQVIAQHGADPSRVYVAGLSAGGAMALVLALAYPELYAAVGVHSGVAYKAGTSLWSAWLAMQAGGHDPRREAARLAARGARAVPLIVFHGARDRVARPSNAEQIVQQWLHLDGGRDGALAPVAERGDGWTRTRWRGADGAARVERWIVDALGHAWSGGRPEGSFTDAGGPSASAEIMRFFAEHAQSANAAAG